MQQLGERHFGTTMDSGIAILIITLIGFLSFNAQALETTGSGRLSPWISGLDEDERLITILQTNDVHGGVEPVQNKKSTRTGGMAFYSGVMSSIKQGLQNKYGKNAGVLVVDAGDQFQGTLLSNYTEGSLLFEIMSHMGFDAVIPGNHDYDFGPTGWLDDRVNPNNPDKNPRGALEKALKLATFPFLAANVYLRSSLRDESGQSIDPENEDPNLIDWSRAIRPPFLQKYTIKRVAGVRVALIGLDNPQTPRMTTAENVADYYFRSDIETYMEVRKELEGKADVFVAIMHKGDAVSEFQASDFVRALTDKGNTWGEGKRGREKASGPRVIDAVIAGHTHFLNNTVVNGVPVIQSRANGEFYGRLDLVYNTDKKRVDVSKMRPLGGLELLHESCPPRSEEFCSVNNSGSGVMMEGVAVEEDGAVIAMIQKVREQVAPLAQRPIGRALEAVYRHSYKQNALSNIMTDALRALSAADVAIINSRGLRADLQEGVVTYEDLFRVIPFSNHGVTVGPMPIATLVRLLEKSVKTCGAYSALMFSGLRLKVEKDCPGRERYGMDYEAKILEIRLDDGKLLYTERGGVRVPKSYTLNVATLDYLKDGGSGYTDFKKVPLIRGLGILREVLASQFFTNPARFTNQIDERLIEVAGK